MPTSLSTRQTLISAFRRNRADFALSLPFSSLDPIAYKSIAKQVTSSSNGGDDAKASRDLVDLNVDKRAVMVKVKGMKLVGVILRQVQLNELYFVLTFCSSRSYCPLQLSTT